MRTVRHPVGYTLPAFHDRLTKVTYDPVTNTSSEGPYNVNDASVDHVQLVLTPHDPTQSVISILLTRSAGVDGDVTHAWTLLEVDAAHQGTYTAIEEVHLATGDVQASPAFLYEFYDPLAPAATTDSPLCTPWISVDELDCATATDADVYAQAASELLYVASGRRYPGICTSIVRPCVESWCGCGWDWCLSCGRPDGMARLFSPVISIIEVKIDGAAVPAEEYHVYNHEYLQRIGLAWPWQNMSVQAGEVGSWTVEFTHGAAPPLLGVWAAGELACHFASTGEVCELPAHVTSLNRLGVNQQFTPGVTAAFDLPRVRAFLAGYGTTEAHVWSPDMPPYPSEVL